MHIITYRKYWTNWQMFHRWKAHSTAARLTTNDSHILIFFLLLFEESEKWSHPKTDNFWIRWPSKNLKPLMNSHTVQDFYQLFLYKQQIVIWDLSAAFDTVGHSILDSWSNCSSSLPDIKRISIITKSNAKNFVHVFAPLGWMTVLHCCLFRVKHWVSEKPWETIIIVTATIQIKINWIRLKQWHYNMSTL